MALSTGDPRLQVALPAPLSGSLAYHQRLRLSDHELYRLIRAAIRGYGLQPRVSRPTRGACAHALARRQRRQAAPAGGPNRIAGGWLASSRLFRSARCLIREEDFVKFARATREPSSNGCYTLRC